MTDLKFTKEELERRDLDNFNKGYLKCMEDQRPRLIAHEELAFKKGFNSGANLSEHTADAQESWEIYYEYSWGKKAILHIPPSNFQWGTSQND